MITTKQRAFLRSAANSIEPTVQIGKAGVTETVLTTVSNALDAHEIIKLTVLEARKAEDGERLKVEDIGGEWYITTDHEMTKEHYVSFVVYVTDNSIMMFRQYPEWGMNITMPMYRSGRLVWYCSRCGLLYQELSPERR